jgi:hypothetical protein
MGFPHVVQVARLERIRELGTGAPTAETVWVITSLPPERAEPARLMELARQYWEIENGMHYRLDVSAGEDRCRVRQATAAAALGIMRRAVQGEYHGWARHQTKARYRNSKVFLERMSRRINLAIRYLTGGVFRL